MEENTLMNIKLTFLTCCLSLLALTSCNLFKDAPEPDFRDQYVGNYEVQREYYQGEVGGDTTIKRIETIVMEVHYSESDSMLVYPGYDHMPTIWFDDRYQFAIRRGGDFFQMFSSGVPLTLLKGGFIGEDSVFIHGHYEMEDYFTTEIVAGKRVE